MNGKQVFILGYAPDEFRCIVPNCDSSSPSFSDYDFELTVPQEKNDDGELEFNYCKSFKAFDNDTNLDETGMCTEFDNSSTFECSKGNYLYPEDFLVFFSLIYI